MFRVWTGLSKYYIEMERRRHSDEIPYEGLVMCPLTRTKDGYTNASQAMFDIVNASKMIQCTIMVMLISHPVFRYYTFGVTLMMSCLGNVQNLRSPGIGIKESQNGLKVFRIP